jgi:hypothetical protein
MTQSELIDNIYHICTNNTGLYSALFGYDDYDKIMDYTFNFSVSKQFTGSDLNLFLDNIINKIISHNEFETIKNKSGIEYNNKTYSNLFLKDYVIIPDDCKLCDIENYLNDIELTIEDKVINISWTLPIYKV